MPASRPKQLSVLDRRKLVAELYLQSWTQQQIADHTGMSQPTICDDLKQIRQQWRESAVRDFDLAREIELLKLERIERESWAAWERSQKPSQSAVVTGEGAGQQTRKHLKNQTGDPRFLDLVNKCIAQRRALLGLDMAPLLTEHEDDVGLSLELRRDRVLGIVASIRERTGIAGPGTESGRPHPGVVCNGDQPGTLEDGSPPRLPGPDDH